MNLIADAVLSRYVVNFTLICFYERECHGYVIIFHNLQPSTSYECKYSWQSALTRPKIVFGWKTNTIQFNSSSVWSSQSERFCSVFVNVNVSLTKSCVAYQRHPRCFHLETPGAAPQRINWERQQRGKRPQGFSWDEGSFSGVKPTKSQWNKRIYIKSLKQNIVVFQKSSVHFCETALAFALVSFEIWLDSSCILRTSSHAWVLTKSWTRFWKQRLKNSVVLPYLLLN